MKRFVLTTVIAALCAATVAAPAAAQTTNSLVIQVPTEPPGLDMTTSPASAIAAVVFANVQEGLIKIDRTGICGLGKDTDAVHRIAFGAADGEHPVERPGR